MTAPPGLLRVAACITPHGFGHAAIMLAVLDALHSLTAGRLEVTFITAMPDSLVRRRWGRPCRVVMPARPEADVGMVMAGSSSVVDVPRSLAAYAALGAVWEDVVAAEAEVLSAQAPHVVVSCISATALAAAQRLGVPGMGLGPFTWREVLGAYADGSPAVAEILARLGDAYGGAAAMIVTTPAVPMDLPNLRSVGPVGLPGRARPDALPRRSAEERLALVALGGIPEAVPVADWPSVDGWRFVVPEDLGGLSVSDAIATVDAIITKPGYGTFVEAACVGTPILYRARPDWPEMPGMGQWAAQHVRTIEIDIETFAVGAVGHHLQSLVTDPPAACLATPSGNREAAAHVLDFYMKKIL